MGKRIHILSEKDFDALTAVCAHCGPVKIKVYGNTYRCEVAYRQTLKTIRKDRRGTLRELRTMTCARCGFEAAHICQMDLDHINGDRSDHAPENFQTLCSNCHRLKSIAPSLF